MMVGENQAKSHRAAFKSYDKWKSTPVRLYMFSIEYHIILAFRDPKAFDMPGILTEMTQ
jgi:hypothetical protein